MLRNKLRFGLREMRSELNLTYFFFSASFASFSSCLRSYSVRSRICARNSGVSG